MDSRLREDEHFVIKALCTSYSGTWRPGEDPPDAYMALGDHEVAVEISTLTQHVLSEGDGYIPRLSQDSGVISLCDELEVELRDLVPSGMYVAITLSSPLKRIHKVKAKLAAAIADTAQRRARVEQVIDIHGNKVEIHLLPGDRPSAKKVVGVVANRNSSSSIGANVQYILHERVADKAKKCSSIKHRPLWLALFNDYWLAEPDSYQRAIEGMTIEHPFDRILLVLGNKKVFTLCKR